MGAYVGLYAKLFRGEAGSKATIEVGNVKDLNVNMDTDTAEATTRASGGYKSYLPALKDVTMDFSMNADSADADFVAIRTAYISNTPIALFPANNSGEAGLDADWIITSFSETQNLSEVVTVSVTAKPYTGERNPQYVDEAGA